MNRYVFGVKKSIFWAIAVVVSLSTILGITSLIVNIKHVAQCADKRTMIMGLILGVIITLGIIGGAPKLIALVN